MIWKVVKGYEEYYEVSDMGDVRSKDRWVNNNGTMEYRKGRILKSKDCKGYKIVALCKDGNPKNFRVARLVAEAFIPNPDNKPYIDHINTIRTDDCVTNLRWVTREENMNNPLTKQHCAESKGKKIKVFFSNGLNNTFDSIVDAAKKLNITRQTIYRSIKGERIYNGDLRFELC